MESVFAADGTLSHYRCTECGWTVPALSVGSIETLARSRELAERSFKRHLCADYKMPHGERRRHTRYPVAGRAELRAGAITIAADPLHIGRGGMAVSTGESLPVETQVRLLFTLSGHPGAVAVRATVVRAGSGVIRLRFDDSPPELDRLMRELESI